MICRKALKKQNGKQGFFGSFPVSSRNPVLAKSGANEGKVFHKKNNPLLLFLNEGLDNNPMGKP
jgi:hypothetical protein